MPSTCAPSSIRWDRLLRTREKSLGVSVVEEVTTPCPEMSAARTRKLVHYEGKFPICRGRDETAFWPTSAWRSATQASNLQMSKASSNSSGTTTSATAMKQTKSLRPISSHGLVAAAISLAKTNATNELGSLPWPARKLHEDSQTVRCKGFSRNHSMPPKGGTTNGAIQLMQCPTTRPVWVNRRPESQLHRER